MYDEFKDIAEFRMVYITEAHAADGRRPVEYAKDLNLFEHKKLDERCAAAERLFKDKQLTIPCVIDGMDNRVNQAFSAHPDRIFVVRSDGRLAVAGDRGPFGFEPALQDTLRWLRALRDKGAEPELSSRAAASGDDRHVTPSDIQETGTKHKKPASDRPTNPERKSKTERGNGDNVS
jgi:hypothetical protein